MKGLHAEVLTSGTRGTFHNLSRPLLVGRKRQIGVWLVMEGAGFTYPDLNVAVLNSVTRGSLRGESVERSSEALFLPGKHFV